MKTDEPHREVRRSKRLETAWKHVRDNGRKSRSKKTRSEIDEYSAEIYKNLRSIQGQLSRNSFRFDPARGWAEPPKDPLKKHRPIVITPVRSRIVQRSILDVLLDQKGIKQFIEQPNSFGGIKKSDPDSAAAVPGAIIAAVSHILNGKPHFVRSDISGFFRHIPKSIVCSKIRSVVDDQAFCDLIESSIEVELHNLDELREHIDLFPKEDIGVAQGCALSPLLGNILLCDFDSDLNAANCACIRYIDDFLILGPSEQEVQDTFALALEHLSKFGMEAYNPLDRPDKAEIGHVDHEGLTFLGVEIINGSVRPSKKNRGSLLQSVKEIIDDHTRKTPHERPDDDWDYSHSFARYLSTINAVVAGWGNQYYFCNDRKIMDELDQKISEMLRQGSDRFRSLSRALGHLGRRRLIGVRSLHDCKVDPIQWKRH